MTAPDYRQARSAGAPLPPRWFIRLAWRAHRAMYRITGGRFGLRRKTPTSWGMMRLTTIGRRTGSGATCHPRVLRGRSRTWSPWP